MDRLTSLQLWQHIWGRYPSYRCYSIISMLYSGLVVSHVFRQPWGNRVERTDQYFFSAAARWKHGFKLCWNIPSFRPGCWILVPLMEIVCVSWQCHEFSYLPCSNPCPALSLSWEGLSLWAFPALWQGKRQSHKHIFTPPLTNTHGMTVKPKHVLQLVLISYCLMAMSLPQSQVSSSRGILF